MTTNFAQKVLDLAAKVTAQRPKVVIDHIIAHGQITTEELKSQYGYNHPPRAACDVREQGIPLKTIRVRGSDGRSIGAYTFGNPDAIKAGRIGGRKAFSKKFKANLIAKLGQKCTLTGEFLDDRYLQVDHRIPYGVAGDDADNYGDLDSYMLLDASAQRAKSFSCENCENFKTLLDVEICKNCYWAYPENYTHVATKPKRMLALTWSGESEAADYDKLVKEANAANLSLLDYAKRKLK